MNRHTRCIISLIYLCWWTASFAWALSGQTATWQESLSRARQVASESNYLEAESALLAGISEANRSGQAEGVDSCLGVLADLYRLEKKPDDAERTLKALIAV